MTMLVALAGRFVVLGVTTGVMAATSTAAPLLIPSVVTTAVNSPAMAGSVVKATLRLVAVALATEKPVAAATTGVHEIDRAVDAFAAASDLLRARAQERERAAELQHTLTRELEHRSNNLLAVIQAIATAREGHELAVRRHDEPMAVALERRLHHYEAHRPAGKAP